MKILVCVKQVPATGTVPVNAKSYTLERDKAQMVLNPVDGCCLENALQLKEQYSGTVTLLSMGRPEAEKMLRSLSAIGGDEFYLISDPVFAGADTYATASVLCRAVKHLGGFDLILCGERTIDGETGQVGPELAAMLDWNFAGYVTKFTLLEDGRMRCRCQDGDFCYPFPLVASVSRNCVLRFPGLASLGRAGRTQIRILDSRMLGGKAESLTKVIGIQRKEVQRRKAVWYPPNQPGIRRLLEEAGMMMALKENEKRMDHGKDPGYKMV